MPLYPDYQQTSTGINPSVQRNSLVDPGADIATAPSTNTEISSSLRCTVTVASSGIVIVRQAIVMSMSGANDAIIGVGVDGVVGALDTMAMAFNAAATIMEITGGRVITGLSLGAHTFYMVWRQAGGGNLQIPCHTRGASSTGTWQEVLAL